ncbi:MAG: cell division protein FtsZ, partial [Leucobacter sp.]|nr:cell division protein FtsZ [Leucobacter sp.]
VVTRPFSFEGKRRAAQADTGIHTLREAVDTLIVVPNDRLLEISEPGISMIEAFAAADQVLLAGVRGITNLITTPGLINVDFADVKSVMQGAGSALMGIGSARGADRAIKAAELAVASPLLETSIEGAHGVLISIQGSSNLALSEMTEASELVHDVVHPEANIIFGTVIDESLGDEVRVTVIAAGFDPEQLGSHAEPQSASTGRRRGRSESLEDPAPIAAAAAAIGLGSSLRADTENESDAGPAANGAETDAPGEFGEILVNPPVEEQLVDDDFSDDDNLSLPEFLR